MAPPKIKQVIVCLLNICETYLGSQSFCILVTYISRFYNSSKGMLIFLYFWNLEVFNDWTTTGRLEIDDLRYFLLPGSVSEDLATISCL